jgi:CubicO group peptidase (beta-lactamase class C family)
MASPFMTLTPADVAELIDQYVDEQCRSRTVPWLVVAVVVDGAVDHLRVATLDGHEHAGVDADTAFRIASMTKSFTAATVLGLRDDGLLRLDEPIATYVPALADLALPSDDSPALTVRLLLSMAAGLATDDPWGDRQLQRTGEWLEELMASGLTFASPPGVTMDYSNLGYAILGRVVEAVTHTPCAEVITERIIQPLGLSRTVWETSQLPASTLHAQPHRLRAGRVELDDPPLGTGAFSPMGGLWSTAADLAQWVDFMSSAFPARSDDDQGPLRRSSRREMQQAHRSGDLRPSMRNDGSLRAVSLGYGFGVQVLHHAGLGRVAMHSGGLPGYGSNMRWVPGRRVGVVALGNRTYPGLVAVTDQVLDLLYDGGVVPGDPPVDDTHLVGVAGRLMSLINEWDHDRAHALFADNVELDLPLADRAAELAELRESLGEVWIDEIDAESITEGAAVLRSERGVVRVELMLTPQAPPRLQWYEIGAIARDER